MEKSNSLRLEVVATIALTIACGFMQQVRAQNITIEVNTELGTVNRAVLGNNTLVFPLNGRNTTHHIDGDGVWDPTNYHSVPEMVVFAKDIGVSSSRYTGNNFNWKDGVGPIAQRPAIYGLNQDEAITFGLPEYLKNCQDIGSTPLISVSDRVGTAIDAADLVEYLNAPNDGSNPNGGTDWAQIRASDGFPDPLGIIWFGYGNETYNFSELTSDQYITDYKACQAAMQAVDTSIKLGAVLHNDGANQNWTKDIIHGTGQTADFFIIHSYVPTYNKNDGVPSAETLFNIGLAGTNNQLQNYYQKLNDLIYNMTGRNSIPIMVTEFNALFVQNNPVPYRLTLGNALINADQIRQMMHADNIQSANYWHFSNSYFGMIKGYAAPYILRPNYYPFQFYNNLFGDKLINAQVVSGAYETTGGYGVDFATGVHQDELLFSDVLSNTNILNNNGFESDWSGWYHPADPTGAVTSIDSAVSHTSIKSAKLVFDGSTDVNFYHTRQLNIIVSPNTDYVIQGYIKTDNIITDGQGVKLEVQDSRGWTYGLWDTSNLTGTHEWTYVSRVFTTASDTTAVVVHLKRTGGGGVISGTAWWDDVKLGTKQVWSITPISGAVASETNNFLTVNFDGTTDLDYSHSQKAATVDPSTWYRLSGKIKTTNITSSQGVYLGVGSNIDLIANGGFENDWTNWYHPADPIGAISSIDSTISFAGLKSAKVVFDGTTDVNFYQPRQTNIVVTPNTTYTIEGYIKTDNIVTTGQGVKLEIQDSRGYTYGLWDTSYLTGTNNWTYVSRTFTTGPDTTGVVIHLKRTGGGGAISGTAWWDQVRLNDQITQKLTGTNDWWYVETDFKTAPTASTVTILAGRKSGGGLITGTAEFKDVRLRKLTPENHGAVPYLSVNASKSTDGTKTYLMVINKDMVNDITSTVSLNGIVPISAQAWTLNGPSVDATNETAANVGVTYNNVGLVTNGFNFTFPAHSLTALEINSTAITNTLLNNGFENSWTDWYHPADPTGTVTSIDNTVSYAGLQSAKVVFDGTTDVNFYQPRQTNITVAPSATYVIEGYIKTDNIFTTGQGVKLEVQDSRGWTYGLWDTTYLTGTNGWTYVSRVFTTPTDATAVVVHLKRTGGGGVISGTAWWDKVKLYSQ